MTVELSPSCKDVAKSIPAWGISNAMTSDQYRTVRFEGKQEGNVDIGKHREMMIERKTESDDIILKVMNELWML